MVFGQENNDAPGKQVFKFRNGLHKDWDTDGWEDGEKLKKKNVEQISGVIEK